MIHPVLHKVILSLTVCSMISASGFAQATPPKITLVPYVPPGLLQYRDVGLLAAVQGSAPLVFQWQYNRQEIPGATNSSLALRNLQPSIGQDTFLGPGSLEGEYRMVVTNLYGTATHSWTISVQPVPRIVSIEPRGTNALVGWRGGIPPYEVERCSDLGAANWQTVATALMATNLIVSAAPALAYYRIAGRRQ